ncbi:MAG: bifunctional tetrahydrofolate synthase/dihydrofolate synthase [Thiopseudomonas sp.]|nr:bifunctional tetrahydrofolate synthase/dihydrofolate synthase [Thiopseudomonas sp.]MCK9465229.1 bifunctional tetrahydrofolate synthase/dihydrofolate synthase [Thiopseudomonas sp.]
MPERTLQQWLSYLEQLHPSEIELGLARIQTVAERMDVQRPASKVITVTGTNGKGSTCAFVAQLLMQQQLQVGVYSSPHFLHYNERIQINGEAVSDALICAAFVAVEQARQDISLTYFEFGTLAALWVFTQAKLDAVVLEVGLGGRLDAVNIIEPDISVVTSIAVDHTDWLGDTRETVAFEKAGIFRAGKPAVCGDLLPPASLLEQAKNLGAPLVLRGRDFDLAVAQHAWHWRGINAKHEPIELQSIPLLDLPIENAALALQVYALLDMPWQPERIIESLQSTKLTGRLQVIKLPYKNQQRTLILDVAHNPHAAEYLAGWLESRPIAGQRYAVFGALADKDVQGVIAAMTKRVADWAIAPLPSPRSYQIADLERIFATNHASVKSYDSVVHAFAAQLDRANETDEIIVFGSFFTVTQALEFLQQA